MQWKRNLLKNSLILFFILGQAYLSFGQTTFQHDTEDEHYLLLLASPLTNMDEWVAAMSQYNAQHFPQRGLKIQRATIQLAKKERVILVKSFPNLQEAENYWLHLRKNNASGIAKTIAQNFWLITPTNLNKVLLAKSMKAYQQYFDRYYILK